MQPTKFKTFHQEYGGYFDSTYCKMRLLKFRNEHEIEKEQEIKKHEIKNLEKNMK